jgi:hypothetical protein
VGGELIEKRGEARAQELLPDSRPARDPPTSWTPPFKGVVEVFPLGVEIVGGGESSGPFIGESLRLPGIRGGAPRGVGSDSDSARNE